MTISDPSLVLTFMGGDLPAGHSAVQTVGSEHIINNSIAFTFQLLNGLRSSSNLVALQLSRDCAAIGDIIATDGDIKAVLMDGTAALFTGYLSTSFSWRVAQSGEQALAVTIEDTSVRRLSGPFISSGEHLFDCEASEALEALSEASGVAISSAAVAITDHITRVVDSTMSCAEIMDQLLYELGYVYYCDNLGELRWFRIDVDSIEDIPVLDRTRLHVVNGSAIELSKKIRTYRAVRISYTELASADSYLVYRNTTGQDSVHPFCNLVLQPGEHFDGLEIYTAEEWAEETADQFREDALVEACNAESETSIVGSGRIVSVSNVRMLASKGSSVAASIAAAGGPWLKISAVNNGASEASIERLDAYASILYEKAEGVIRTGSAGSSTDTLYSEELSYIHTRELATRHANLVNQYHHYCNSQYTFYSDEDITLGSLARLNDNEHSGLSVAVMVIGKSVSYGHVNRYVAIGITVFNLDAKAYHRNTETAGADTRGTSSSWYNGTALQGTGNARGAAGTAGDYYLNTDTGNIYRCISGGSSTAALWQYVGNIKGADADVGSMTYEIEYKVSSSDTDPQEESRIGFISSGTADVFGAQEDGSAFDYAFVDSIWADSYAWYRGLYVWQRLKITDADGNVTYGEPTYAAELTQSLVNGCRLDLSSVPQTYESNPRRRDFQYLPFRIRNIGHKGSLVLTAAGCVFSRLVEGEWQDLGNSLTISFEGSADIDSYSLKIAYSQSSTISISGTMTEWDGSLVYASMTIPASARKTVAIQMETVAAHADLPTSATVSDGASGVEAGDNLIAGDYILTRFVTLTPDSSTTAQDETNEAWDISDFSSYYTRSGDTFTPISISAFSIGTTYYGFGIYAWTYDGTAWIRSATASVETATVKEAVALARAQHAIDPTVDYTTCLYAHRVLVEELTAGVINVGKIFVNDIESSNFEETGGLIVSGYKLEYAGGEDGKGVIKAHSGHFTDAVIDGNTQIGEALFVNGLIENWDADGNIAMKTVKDTVVSAVYSSSKSDATSSPNAYSNSEWVNYLKNTFFQQLTANTEIAVSSCKLLKADGTTVTALEYAAYFTSLASAQTTTISCTADIDESETRTVFTNFSHKSIVLSKLRVTPKYTSKQETIAGSTVTFRYVGSVVARVYNQDNSLYSTVINKGRGYYAGDYSAGSVTVPPLGYVTVAWGGEIVWLYPSGNGSCKVTYDESANFSLGACFLGSGYCTKIEEFLRNSGFSTLAGTLLTVGSVSMALPFTAEASWPITKYYVFGWDQSPGNTEDITTSLLDPASFFIYDGTAVEIDYVRYSATYLCIWDRNGNVYELSTGYHPDYSLEIDVFADTVGTHTQNVMPVYDAQGDIVGGDIGTLSKPWENIVARHFLGGLEAILLTGDETLTEEDIAPGTVRVIVAVASCSLTLPPGGTYLYKGVQYSQSSVLTVTAMEIEILARLD